MKNKSLLSIMLFTSVAIAEVPTTPPESSVQITATGEVAKYCGFYGNIGNNINGFVFKGDSSEGKTVDINIFSNSKQTPVISVVVSDNVLKKADSTDTVEAVLMSDKVPVDGMEISKGVQETLSLYVNVDEHEHLLEATEEEVTINYTLNLSCNDPEQP